VPPVADGETAPYEPVRWIDGATVLLDQTLLPHTVVERRIEDLDDGIEAIRSMRVRGAPAIGVAAAYVLARSIAQSGVDGLDTRAERLAAARPTAVNLRWAVERVQRAVEGVTPAEAAGAALVEARAIHEEQRAADASMAQAGVALLPPSLSEVITHCNTGPLATAGGLGTALGVVIAGHHAGRIGGVLVDETRPRLQGARLTSWELTQHGVPHHIIADGAAASLVASRGVAAAFVGADRIAANGDTANKVGTLGLALACRYRGVPFYVVAPLSTIDIETPSGDVIEVEERAEDEVLAVDGVRLAAAGASALNPAFDVTPAELVTAIVTERGVLRAPFAASIAAALAKRPERA